MPMRADSAPRLDARNGRPRNNGVGARSLHADVADGAGDDPGRTVVLVGHDAAGEPLNVPRLQAMGNVHVLTQKGGYGDFSHVDRYLEAAGWLDANGVDYEWLENLSGQCYPLRPIAQIEHELTVIGDLGFAGYFLVVWDIARVCRDNRRLGRLVRRLLGDHY